MGGLMRRAAFVDRDGTINVRPAEHEYVSSEADFRWLPGALEGLVRLAHAGYVLAVVSNQRGVSRGLVSIETLRAIERLIQGELARHGCSITAFRYCFHGDDDGCDCRKPKPGMITGLRPEIGVILERSWVIGDSERDVLAGKAAGCRTILIGDEQSQTSADMIVPSLLDASLRLSGSGDQPLRASPAASNSFTSA